MEKCFYQVAQIYTPASPGVQVMPYGSSKLVKSIQR